MRASLHALHLRLPATGKQGLAEVDLLRLAQFHNLKSLCLARSANVTDAVVVECLLHMPHLVELDVSECDDFTGDTLLADLRYQPAVRLSRLDCRGLLTAEGLRALQHVAPNLVWLGVVLSRYSKEDLVASFVAPCDAGKIDVNEAGFLRAGAAVAPPPVVPAPATAAGARRRRTGSAVAAAAAPISGWVPTLTPALPRLRVVATGGKSVLLTPFLDFMQTALGLAFDASD
jgi:hypothetical protein